MQGRCLCNAVTVTTADHTDMDACHCGMCRRWGSGPLMSVRCGSDVQFGGIDKIATFRSSEWAERGFCSVCGTHLYYRLIPANDFSLSMGLFQEGPEFVFREEIFIDRKPRSYEFANATSKLTEAEVFAKYAPG